MLCHLNLTKIEIEKWLDQKIHKFATHENKTPQVSEKRWLYRDMYMEIQEIFFASFPSKLYEWIVRLANNQGRCRLNQPIVWTPKLVRRLEASEDKIA